MLEDQDCATVCYGSTVIIGSDEETSIRDQHNLSEVRPGGTIQHLSLMPISIGIQMIDVDFVDILCSSDGNRILDVHVPAEIRVGIMLEELTLMVGDGRGSDAEGGLSLAS